jgi:putative transposase
MARRPVPIHVKAKDLDELGQLLRGGVQQVRVVLRALALRLLAGQVTAPHVAETVPLTAKAIREIAHGYNDGGLDLALCEGGIKNLLGPRPLLPRSSGLSRWCADPPQGRARWTVRLIVQEAVKRKLVPRVGRETIRVLLESHDLKPWREKNVVRGRTERRLHRKDGRRVGGVREAL